MNNATPYVEALEALQQGFAAGIGQGGEEAQKLVRDLESKLYEG